MYSNFFIVDAKPTYFVLLGRDWIYASQCTPFILHQQLLFWEEDQVSIISADDCPILVDVRMAEALFYSPYLTPIQIPNNYKEGT